MNRNKNKSSTTINSITYAEAESIYISELKSNEASAQEIKNTRLVLKSWRNILNLAHNSAIGDELGNLFKQNTNTYIKRQKQLNKKASTYTSYVSRIKKFKNFFLRFSDFQLLPSSFGERLKFLLEKKGFSATKFARDYLKGQIEVMTLQNWCNGTHLPCKEKLSTVRKIETILKIPLDTLTSTLLVTKTTDDLPRRTSFGKKIQAARKNVYSIWTKRLEDEYKDLTEYKSCAVLPENLKRNERAIWTFSDNRLPTAEIIKYQLKLFFGYCYLPKDAANPMRRGLGMNKNSLTLALLTDKKVLESYFVIFKKVRAGNTFNSGFITFINTIACLLRKNTGYLYQRPELAEKAGLCLTKAKWEERCLATHARLCEIKKSIEHAKKSGSNEYELGRNPREPIQEILNKKNPLLVTLQMTKNMLEDAEKLPHRSIRKAILYRDILLIALLQANPLRAKMFKIMKLNDNLVKEKDGSWWITFKRNDFKNRKSLKKDYRVKVSPVIWHMIERYLNEFRPRLLDGKKGELVFVKKTAKKRKMANVALLNSTIFCIVMKRTKQYIPNCPGFGPHAFRHIVATSIIKNNPGKGYYLAAKVLNDQIQTVELAYAHLKTSEMFEPYNEFLTENFLNAGFDISNLSSPIKQEEK